MNITMKKKPRAPQVGDLFTHLNGGVDKIISINDDDIDLESDGLWGRCEFYEKWTHATRRSPLVGDVWLYVDEVVHVVLARASALGGGRFDVESADGRRWRLTARGPGSDKWRLVSTGARTLADLEAAGELPDITEDDRTPLERMTAERDALRAERDNMRGAYQRLQARMVEAERAAAEDWDFQVRQQGEIRALRAKLAKGRGDITFARAFAASQGRVIAGLKRPRCTECGDMIRPGHEGYAVTRGGDDARYTHTRCADALNHRADAVAAVEGLPPRADLAEALDALRGMVEMRCSVEGGRIKAHSAMIGLRSEYAESVTALTVLAKHGIVENWDGRHADWADDAQEVAE